jgi:pimeloyl-ACP methyl ester carboxylesterase
MRSEPAVWGTLASADLCASARVGPLRIGQYAPVEVRGPTTLRGRDARKLGRFRDDVARRRFLTAYDNALAAWPTQPSQFDVETRCGTTHVLATGPESGTPIVLLHAVAVSSPSWFANVAALSADRPVYAIDTIGDAGRSAQTSRIRDGDDLSLWLDDVLAALDLDRAHLVGLSYGGWLALNQARRLPGRLASVTSVDPPGALGRASGAFVIKILPDSLLAKFAKSDKALYRLLRLLNNGTLPAQPLLELSVAGLRTFRARLPYPKRMSDDVLRTLDTPTLLLFCERSPVNHAQRALERSRQLIANVETEVIPDVGHMLPVEMPEVFTTRVLRFIHNIDTRHHMNPPGYE